MAVRNRVCGPTQCGIIASTTRRTKGGCKPDVGRCMPGASLSRRRPGQAPLGKPALQPYWGKPAVRNDRGDRGNVGIIRSPVRASILPDYIRVMSVGSVPFVTGLLYSPTTDVERTSQNRRLVPGTDLGTYPCSRDDIQSCLCGGATCMARKPERSIDVATKPELFASSTNSLRAVSRPA